MYDNHMSLFGDSKNMRGNIEQKRGASSDGCENHVGVVNTLFAPWLKI